jgi:hypothetical protein
MTLVRYDSHSGLPISATGRACGKEGLRVGVDGTHAILVIMGADGDVFPSVGLGARLRGRGHRVTLAGPETYQGLAALWHGLLTVPCG